MTRRLASLTNRIFLASALLVVLSIGAATWLFNVTVTAQAERELQRGLEEAGSIVEQYRILAVSQLAQQARLIADLPKFKAAVELDHPPTLAPLADDYRRQINSDLFVVAGQTGHLLAHGGLTDDGDRREVLRSPALRAALRGQESTSFLPRADSVLQVVTVPIWIDPAAPDILGALSVGVALDERFAGQIKHLTDSDIAFGFGSRIRASTLPARTAPDLEGVLRSGRAGRVHLDDEEYVSLVRPLAGDVPGPRPLRHVEAAAGSSGVAGPVVLVLRSRTDRLRPLRALHTALLATAVVSVLLATLLAYLVARTITRPLATITAAMRETASTGDLTRRLSLPADNPWDDEDARLLASNFNAMTTSIARFQQEVAQRERLSSLGRLSTVVAHEIRNPLMIIKAALRTLRRANLRDTALAGAVADIDGEVDRLNRLVNEVLDFARPIRFEVGRASLSAICRDAVEAVDAERPGPACRLDLDPAADDIVTDAERLRQALINLLINARQAVSGDGSAPGASGASATGAPPVDVSTAAGSDGRLRVRVQDRGPGIPAEALSRVFEPYFTTKRTGTGIGLAIARNIIDGLGGTIVVRSRIGEGTEVLVDLPRVPPDRVSASSSS